VLRMLSTAVTP